MASSLPIIAITIGDPAGIGPEIVAGALAHEHLHDICRPLVIGDLSVLQRGAQAMGVSLAWRSISDPSEARFEAGSPDVLDLGSPGIDGVAWGVAQGDAGRAAAGYVEKAIALALTDSVDAMATAPINKTSLKIGDVPYLDHTAMLARLTDSSEPMTLFVLDDLRIFFATRHLSLARAVAGIKREVIAHTLVEAAAALRGFGITHPRIAVAALNPHGGEGGMFGDTEENEIAPGISDARAMGVDASGPYPADSLFHLVRVQKSADAVLSLFHDQGHIAAKSMDFERTIALTTGLPFVRASVDHGTAFDIAGTGKASYVSMAECVRVAARYAALFQAAKEQQPAS